MHYSPQCNMGKSQELKFSPDVQKMQTLGDDELRRWREPWQTLDLSMLQY